MRFRYCYFRMWAAAARIRSGLISGRSLLARISFIGAGFYHLMLAPIVAAILGSVGAGLGLVSRRFVRRSPA